MRKELLVAASVLAIVSATTYNVSLGVIEAWHIKWMALFVIFGAAMGTFVYLRTNIFAGLLTTYLLVNSAYIAAMPFLPISDASKYKTLLAAYSLVSIIGLSYMFSLFRKYTEWAIAGSCIFVSVLTVVVKYAHIQAIGDFSGVFGNHSMNGCYIAITAPFLLKKAGFKAAFIPIIGVFISPASMSVGCLAVAFAAYYFSIKRAWIPLTTFVVMMLAGSLMDKQFVDDNKRFETYRLFHNEWKANKQISPLFGIGNGLFSEWGKEIQKRTGYNLERVDTPTIKGVKGFFYYIHSDWLELLLSNGYLALLLATSAFFHACIAAIRRNQLYLLAALLSWSACAIFNYPARLAAHALVCGITVALIYSRKGEEYEESKEACQESQKAR